MCRFHLLPQASVAVATHVERFQEPISRKVDLHLAQITGRNGSERQPRSARQSRPDRGDHKTTATSPQTPWLSSDLCRTARNAAGAVCMSARWPPSSTGNARFDSQERDRPLLALQSSRSQQCICQWTWYSTDKWHKSKSFTASVPSRQAQAYNLSPGGLTAVATTIATSVVQLI